MTESTVPTDHDPSEQKNTTYELFIGALSILSIANLFLYYFARDPDVKDVVYLMDWVLSFVFLIDFTYRIATAKSKSNYFFRQYGWADLIASFPFPQVKILRIFRLIRVGRMVRHYGARHLVSEFVSNRGSSALLSLLFLMVLVLEFGGMAILAVEGRSPDANIKTASDSLWYIYVSITTVGYGDRYPVTNAGRIVGILVLTVGVGLFGTLTGFLANAFLAPAKEEDETEAEQPAPVAAISTDTPPDVQTLLAEQKRMLADLQAKYAQLELLLTGTKPSEAEPGV